MYEKNSPYFILQELDKKETMTKARNTTIDTLRFVAILIVILIHTDIFKYSSESYASQSFKVLFNFIKSLRISVPFFFIVSGYFLGKKILAGEPPFPLLKKTFKRLFFIFICWDIIYFITPSNWIEMSIKYDLIRPIYWNMAHMSKIIINDPFSAILKGTESHLWFLPALIIGLAIMATFIHYKKEKYLMLFAAFLYILGLLGKSYQCLLFDFKAPFLSKYGPFTSTLFVSLGWWAAQKKKFFPHEGFILLVIGIIIMSIEIHILCRHNNIPFVTDYLLGTIPFSMGVLILALTYPNIGKNTIFPYLGSTFTLGIYLSQVLISNNLNYLQPFSAPIVWDLTFSIGVFLTSITAISIYKKSVLAYKLTTQKAILT